MKMKIPMIAHDDDAPDHEEMLRERAHAAHRDVVESWVKGHASDKELDRAHKRMKKVCGE